jgi:hypothetical protein
MKLLPVGQNIILDKKIYSFLYLKAPFSVLSFQITLITALWGIIIDIQAK